MKQCYRCISILALLALVIIGAQPSAAQVAPAALTQPERLGFFGMNTYFTGLERIRNDGDEGIATLVAMGRAVGITWAREELSWGNLERQGKGRWEWSYFDRRLLQAAQAGYGIVGMLLTTPAWARVGDCAARIQRYAWAGVTTDDYWCPPANPQDFADYVYATVERYDGDGKGDAPGSPRVAVWQIWNEPNHWETWPGTPAEYAAILQAGYAAAKAADPTAIVAVGGLYVFDGVWADNVGHTDGLRFFDAALAAAPGAWRSFDALAIHPFMPDVAPDAPGIVARVTLWGRLTTTRDWLAERTRRFGGPPRPIWISEVGWSNCTLLDPHCYVGMASAAQPAADTPVPGAWQLAVGASGARPPAGAALAADLQAFIGKDEQQQANYMVRAHAIALALGVQHLSYFQFEDKFDGSARNFWQEASIVRTRATGYQPRAAYHAYGVMLRQLEGATFVGFGPLHTYQYDPNAAHNPAARYHLRFQSADNVLIDLLWRSSSGEQVSLALEAGRSAALVTRDGVQQSLTAAGGAVRFSVGEQPVYLRQSAPPALTVAPSALTVLVEPGELPQTRIVTVGNAGSGVLTWSAGSNVAWLQVGATSGQGWRSTLPLVIDPAGLAIGDHNANLRIDSSGGASQIPVRVIVAERLWRSYFPFAAR